MCGCFLSECFLVSFVVRCVHMDMDAYQRESKKTVSETLKKIDERSYLLYLVLGLVGESGEVADKVKKVIRDDNWEISDEKREDLKQELGDVLWYLARLTESFDSSVSEVAEKNIEKLQSRMDRGVLHGSGDDR